MERVVLLCLIGLLTCFTCREATEYDEMLKEYYKDSVPLIKQTTFQQVIKRKKTPLILDCRERDEFEVSHIPGAIWLGYEDVDFSQIPDSLDKSKPIVVYCSIGYRSERIGEQLQEKGYTNVKNLYGGIFLWANQQNVVIAGKGDTVKAIHPYNESWGKWLSDSIVEKRYKPED